MNKLRYSPRSQASGTARLFVNKHSEGSSPSPVIERISLLGVWVREIFHQGPASSPFC